MPNLELRRALGAYDFLVFSVDRLHPPGQIRIGNPNGSAARYIIGGAPLAAVPQITPDPRVTFDLFADPTPVALTGTVTVTKGSTDVVGVGTAFTTEVVVGEVVARPDGLILGRVAAIADNTHLSLSAPWAGVTAAGSVLNKVTTNPKTVPASGIVTHDLPIGGVGNRFVVIVRSLELPIGFTAIGGDQTQFAILQDGKAQTQLA